MDVMQENANELTAVTTNTAISSPTSNYANVPGELHTLQSKLHETRNELNMLRAKVDYLEYTARTSNTSQNSGSYHANGYFDASGYFHNTGNSNFGSIPMDQLNTLYTEVAESIDSVRFELNNRITNNLKAEVDKSVNRFLPSKRVNRPSTVDKELAVLLKKLLDIAYNSEVEDPSIVLEELCKAIKEILFLTVVSAQCEKEYKMLLTKSIPKVQPAGSLSPVRDATAIGNNILRQNQEANTNNLLVNSPENSDILRNPSRAVRVGLAYDVGDEAIRNADEDVANTALENNDTDNNLLNAAAERTRAAVVPPETREALRNVIRPELAEFIRSHIDLDSDQYQTFFDPVNSCVVTYRPQSNDVEIQSLYNPNAVEYLGIESLGIRPLGVRAF